MKKTFTILSLLTGLTGISQITTQTLNTTTSVSATNQTITTYTILTTNTVLNNDNMFGFAFNWNTFTSFTNTTSGVLKVIMNGAPYDSFTLSKNLTTNAFDSLRINLSLASTDPTNTMAVNGATFVSTITTNTPQYQAHSVRVINTNTLTTTYSLVLTGGINTFSSIFLKDLIVKGYSTSIKSDTTSAPTNTITTGIKNNTNTELNLFVAGNTIKPNAQNENLKLKVFDLTGKKVFENILTNEIKLDLNTGIYILNVFTQSENLIQSKRILITNQ